MFAPATPGSVEHAATVAYQRALLVVSPLPSVVLALATDRATSSLVAELSAPLSVDAALVDVAERISECAKPATAVSIADLQSDIDASTRAAPSPFHLKSLIAAWWLVLFTACAPFIFAAHADGFLASQLVALGAACLLGAISTLLFVVAIRATGSASLANGAWSTLRSIGGPASNIWTKALVAVFGLMALSHKEAIYLSATHDSSGRPLSTGRRYRVVVPPSLPAAWWSLTVYDSMRYLVPNALGRYSINSASASAPAASSNPLDRSVALSVDPRPTDDASAQWISLGLAGRAPAKFVLMLRLYRPQFQLERLGELALPHIVAEED